MYFMESGPPLGVGASQSAVGMPPAGVEEVLDIVVLWGLVGIVVAAVLLMACRAFVAWMRPRMTMNKPPLLIMPYPPLLGLY